MVVPNLGVILSPATTRGYLAMSGDFLVVTGWGGDIGI